MNRTMILSLVFVPALYTCAAQSSPPPAAGSNWQHVQVLPAGTSIKVNARSCHANCKVKSVDADSLSCTGKTDMVYQRTDVQSIGISHRGRSAGIGAAVGGGVGAGIGAGSCHNGWQGVCAIGLGAQGAVAGLLVGLFTDFTRSTIYKAP